LIDDGGPLWAGRKAELDGCWWDDQIATCKDWWHKTNKIIKQKRQVKRATTTKKWDTLSKYRHGHSVVFLPEITIQERRRLQREHQLITQQAALFLWSASLYSSLINRLYSRQLLSLSFMFQRQKKNRWAAINLNS
jgi:hypothetical protein